MKDALGYYRLLQVSTNADAENIKHSYRDLAKIWHPDSNHDEKATDIFQKLAIAYDVLGNPKNRLVYDILSLVYTNENYPDMDAMIPYSDDGDGVNINVVNLKEIVSMVYKYKEKNNYKIVTYNNALKLNLKVSIINWLAGWWHPKGFLANIRAIFYNFKNPISKKESLKIMIHNMIAYSKTSQNMLSAKCGLKAKKWLDEEGKKLVDDYISKMDVRVYPPKSKNDIALKLVQLIIPLILIFVLLSGAFSKEVYDWHIFSQKNHINYYQKVNTGYGQSVDDVVVGKVISIPVNKSDESMLYHLTKNAKFMYGPSDNFDVIKMLDKGTTVRLTGITPDKKWARIMIDNGETGFVYHEIIKQGIGKEIPYESSIIE